MPFERGDLIKSLFCIFLFFGGGCYGGFQEAGKL